MKWTSMVHPISWVYTAAVVNEGDHPVASLPLLPQNSCSRSFPLASSRGWEPSPRAPHVVSGQSPDTTWGADFRGNRAL